MVQFVWGVQWVVFDDDCFELQDCVECYDVLWVVGYDQGDWVVGLYVELLQIFGGVIDLIVEFDIVGFVFEEFEGGFFVEFGD